MNSTRATAILLTWTVTGLSAITGGIIEPHSAAAWLMAYIPAMIVAGGAWLIIAVAVLSIFLGFLYGQPCGRARRSSDRWRS